MKNDDRKFTTTDAGIPVSSDEYSLTVGPDGPIHCITIFIAPQWIKSDNERRKHYE
jgi:catalase